MCLKQVPDPQSQLLPAPSGRSIVLSDVPLVLNESDGCALEAALRLVEAQGGENEIVAVTVGTREAEDVLRRALALGASRAVRIAPEVDPPTESRDGPARRESRGESRLCGRDPFSVVVALAGVIEAEAFDLVLTGSQSQLRGHAVVPVALAQRLGWPWLWLAVELTHPDSQGAQSEELEILRELEGGCFESCRLELPAVVAVQSGVNQPRMTSVRGVMAARKKAIEVLDAQQLGVSPGELRCGGGRVEVLRIEVPKRSEACERIAGDAREAAATLIRRLRAEGVL